MKSNAYDVAYEFVKAHKNGTPFCGSRRAGNFSVAGRCVRSYAEVIAFFHEGKFYATTQKFSATTSCHENMFRQAALDLVKPSDLVVVPSIKTAYKMAGVDEVAIGLAA